MQVQYRECNIRRYVYFSSLGCEHRICTGIGKVTHCTGNTANTVRQRGQVSVMTIVNLQVKSINQLGFFRQQIVGDNFGKGNHNIFELHVEC